MQRTPEAVIASIIFILLFVIIMVQVLGRSPLFVGPIWTEELARWLWVWMALIGIGAVEKNDGQLRMGFLAALLPQRIQQLLSLSTDIVYVGLVGHLVWIAYKSVLRTASYESVSLPATDGVLYASALVAMLLVAVRILRRLRQNLASFGS